MADQITTFSRDQDYMSHVLSEISKICHAIIAGELVRMPGNGPIQSHFDSADDLPCIIFGCLRQ
jgi:hypothetical protein